jgi:hypothetical protein
VSLRPANKDRPETRRVFVAKCATLLASGVSVSVVDLVTSRHFNLYTELLEQLGEADPHMPASPVQSIYGTTCRFTELPDPAGWEGRSWRLDAWSYALEIGKLLPTLPLWLTPDLAVPLDLEATYEDTCRTLRIR